MGNDPKTEELRNFLEQVANKETPTTEDLKKFKDFFPCAGEVDVDYVADLWADLNMITRSAFELTFDIAGLERSEREQRKSDARATVESQYSDLILGCYEGERHTPPLLWIADALRQLEDDIRDARLRRCKRASCSRYFIKFRQSDRTRSRTYCSRECYLEDARKPQKRESRNRKRA